MTFDTTFEEFLIDLNKFDHWIDINITFEFQNKYLIDLFRQSITRQTFVFRLASSTLD